MLCSRNLRLITRVILKESQIGCRQISIYLPTRRLLCKSLNKKYSRWMSTTNPTVVTSIEQPKSLNESNVPAGNDLSSNPLTSVSDKSHQLSSTTTTATTTKPSDDFIEGFVIPDPPPIPQKVSMEEVTQLIVDGEPTLISQGLGGWSPSGMVQTALEFMHINCDLPWWTTIVIGTCVVRFVLFPLVIIAQRNAARMNNYLPQMQVLQVKMSEARKSGNAIMAAKYAQELMLFMKDKNVNPLKNMMVPLAQAPVFISCFFGLRAMANLPVESLKTGGLWWFTDLTVADPFYILPLVTSVTLLVALEIGAEAGVRAENMQMMRYVMRALPLIIFPFTMNFPAAILCYWTTSNFISLGQVALLRIPSMRTYFNIEQLVRHDPLNLPIQKKGFVEGLKESYNNTKVMKELDDRLQYDEMRFRKAGLGPIQKTYPFDPTKQATAASAKSRDTK